MGEMDMGDQNGAPLEADTTTAEQVSREDWAEQRRAEARAHLDPPSHFDTPSWLGPSQREYVPPQVPVQPEPVHDQLHVYAPTPIADSVPDAAHWVEHRKPRFFVGALLSLALLGAVASLVFAIVAQSVIAVGALVGCAVIAVIFRGALMSSALTTVDLKSSTLKVREGNELSVFNLADPATRVEVTGTPGSSSWKVVLESVHHREIVLTAANVNPVEFDTILLHYRAVAERERQDRHDRYNR
ncbi:hypothetical protein [Nocardioides marmorisolisilvae]|uniref:Uncharacterized protein n=1 Tax=Nocardioides marmorisolisilvae TaxID=1542737 RepID=A0A3N0DVY3_9ACTN|nr:hypothetical protein [Nocardioides marmorisolisilvae]RNL79764.1 hypothetical protein EFL95_12485 [Nocardioides marmorisolisilvae]